MRVNQDLTSIHDFSPAQGRWRIRPLALVSIVLVIATWEIAAQLYGINQKTGAMVLPTLGQTFGAFKSFSNYWMGGLGAGDTRLGAPETYWGAVLALGYNTAVTIVRLSCGLGLGMVAGIGLAFAISWSRVLREAFSFPAHFARMMPLLGMVPLFALWFGDRPIGVILFVAVAVFVLLFAITLNAIGNVPVYYTQYAQSLGAGPLRIYLKVVFPAIVPQLKSGILLALGFSWSSVVAAEFLGQRYGLGRIVMFAQEFGKTETITLTAIVVVFLAAVTFNIAEQVLRWLTRWVE